MKGAAQSVATLADEHPATAFAPERAATFMFEVAPGQPHPLGATPDAQGVNFSLFSERASAVELLLFDAHNSPEPVQVIALDPKVHRTFHFWHVYVKDLKPGTPYAYRVDGPNDLHGRGDRFNRNKVLVDPYARGHTNALWNRADACGPGDNLGTSMRSVVIDTSSYDWEGDEPLKRPMRETIIYEVHVRGFSRSPSSGAAQPGTFAAVAQKIPYLKALGVTAVELLPVFAFDETEVKQVGAGDTPLPNYWGYDPISFFAPQGSYCVSPETGAHIDEFRDMVKALHKAGLEVILDVVFNHTTEGNHQGPTLNFRGLDNGIYYHLVPDDRGYYMDYSGCGNTLNCNHPVVDRMILDTLQFWVREMHVDGFRFDEGSILARAEDGAPLAHPPVVWHIELSRTLADTKVIAEAWDAAGLYQIGLYPGYRWAEWNGRFRDDMRRFVRGDPGVVGAVAARLAGSADLYEANGHLPINSVNFITCHDGFTLNDLVSYDAKHNEANGEGNRDGNDDNLSWNCGAEGETDDPSVEELRERQVKNFATLLLLAQGVPMFVAGDEVRRTQRGNNNAYCQDNELSWFDWTLPERHAGVLRFFREMIAFRKRHPGLQRGRFFTGEVNARGLPDIAWHGCQLGAPGWNDPGSRVLAFTMGGEAGGADLHVMLNMDDQGLEFDLPAVPGRAWHRAVDTALPSPEDVAEAGTEVLVTGEHYLVTPRSAVVLISKGAA